MTSKKLISLTAVAAVLVILAYLSTTRNVVKTPQRLGRPVFSTIDLSRVSEINIEKETEEQIVLRSTEKGWVVDNLYQYPADITRIREAVLKINQLKVGDISDSSRLGNVPGRVTLKDESGTALAEIVLGTKRMAPFDASTAMYGGGARFDGRYISADDDPAVILVSDALEAFDADATHWIETKLSSVSAADVTAVTITRDGDTLALSKTEGAWSLAGLSNDEELDTHSFNAVESALSYLNLTSVVDPQLTPEALGLTTGVLYRAELNSGEYYVAAIGNKIETGTDRYFKIEAGFTPASTNETANAAIQQKVDAYNTDFGSRVFTISSYNAEKMTKSRADFLKAVEPDEEEKDETTEAR